MDKRREGTVGKSQDEVKPLKPSAKLEALLLSMKKVDGVVSCEAPKIELTPPRGKEVIKKLKERAKQKSYEENLKEAAKNAARVVVGDPSKTESELLKRLMEPDNRMSKESDLKSLVANMKVERAQKPGTAVEGLRPAKRSSPINAEERKKIDLFGAKPLGIFTKPLPGDREPREPGPTSLCPTWDKLQQEELQLMVTHPPRNGFEEMILWTEQGKLWKFPIDNEQDWPERDVPFEEHVFLDEHLEPWCPKTGPIRDFMELVILGLSQNPYMTADYKRRTINWYKDYFESKQSLLEKLGAV